LDELISIAIDLLVNFLDYIALKLEKILINKKNLISSLQKFPMRAPFNHCVIDDFLDDEFADIISGEFPDYYSSDWHIYDNPLENKKTSNNWNSFPPNTYRLLSYLVSLDFVNLLSKELSLDLFPDPGLHGGGWHIHGKGGNLNPHLDYSIHPKSGLLRKLNIIIYLSKDLKPEYGGHFGLWSKSNKNSENLELVKEIEPHFNRAVIFDTTQESWHGISRKIMVPTGVYRKSLAVYYLTYPDSNSDPRTRALFAPREDQTGDESIADLIKSRADDKKFSTVYRTKHD